MLAKTTLQFVVSDQPFSNFSWPSVPTVTNPDLQDELNKHNYMSALSNNISSFKISNLATAPLQQLPSLSNSESYINANASNVEYVFYQYSGLNQFYTCRQSIMNEESLNSSNCPPIYNNISNGFFNGESFSVNVDYKIDGTWITPAMSTQISLSSYCNSLSDELYLSNTNGVAAALWCVPNTTKNLNPNGASTSQLNSISFGGADPHAYLYFSFLGDLNGDNMSNFNFTSSPGTDVTQEFTSNQYKIETAKTTKTDYSNSVFTTGITYTNVATGYQGKFYLQGASSWGSKLDWSLWVSCDMNDPLCVDGGGGNICAAGTLIGISDGNSNTANITTHGSCAYTP